MKSNLRTTQYGVVGKALGLSKQENLTKIELKLLTDVIHYDVNKKTLLRGSSTGGNKSNHVKRKVIKYEDLLVAFMSIFFEELLFSCRD